MSLSVLVIEDNPASLDLMCYLLTAHGHRVESRQDGRAGLARALAEPPDIVLCDIQLPGLDGCAVARRIRQSAQGRHLPLVAVTASALPSECAQVLLAGFDAYLLKPIDPETFVGEVERHHAARRLRTRG